MWSDAGDPEDITLDSSVTGFPGYELLSNQIKKKDHYTLSASVSSDFNDVFGSCTGKWKIKLSPYSYKSINFLLEAQSTM